MVTFPRVPYQADQGYTPEQVRELAENDDLVTACARLDGIVSWGDDEVILTRRQALALIEACEFLFRVRDGLSGAQEVKRPASRVVESVE